LSLVCKIDDDAIVKDSFRKRLIFSPTAYLLILRFSCVSRTSTLVLYDVPGTLLYPLLQYQPLPVVGKCSCDKMTGFAPPIAISSLF
jgi:hypothetical protein